MGLSIEAVKAVFISHEHADHIHGASNVSRKHNIPVYGTPLTLSKYNHTIPAALVRPLQAYQPIQIGPITVTAFPKIHDAHDPHSFIISCGHVRVGVFTDIGAPCDHLVKHFEQCHAAFLESNYDEEMLEKGNYPIHLKNRIRGGMGHLSNREALRLFVRHRSPYLSHLFLSHLSRENNSPELVQKTFLKAARHTQIIIASREKETPLYHITSGGMRMQEPVMLTKKVAQLSLF